jgi:NADPH:quinone reductase-like Zn-dependent oxidoreductase
MEKMKAIIYTQYGPPDVLQLQEVAKPAPGDHEILIKVFATPVSFGDVLVRNFKAVTPKKFHMPFLFWLIGKFYFGFSKPRITIPGSEFSGVVESVGRNVKRFRAGDEVFGYSGSRMGAYAGYLCMPESGVVSMKPANTTHPEAAAMPYGAIMALHVIRKANISPGQQVLVNGASGGIGPAVVQLAKYHGAIVTGVCGTPRMDYVKSLGADKVIDYKNTDFTKNGETYDFIIDILGKRSFSQCKNSLKEGGRLMLISFKMKQVFSMLWTSLSGGKKVDCILSTEKAEDLDYIRNLTEEGKFRSVVDRCFPLEQAAEAHAYAESGNKTGSIVITVQK